MYNLSIIGKNLLVFCLTFEKGEKKSKTETSMKLN